MTNSFPQGTWIPTALKMSSETDTMAYVEVQHLYRLNDDLVAEEKTLPDFGDDQIGLLQQGELLALIHGQSWLWVLGAYEVFVTAHPQSDWLSSST